MLKKRIIGVITVKNNLAVQSFGYNNFLPLGKPEVLAENLDRWGADEILIQCLDCSSKNSGANLKLIETIAIKGLSTPLIYAGGIQTKKDAIEAIKFGADRICIDSMLHNNIESCIEISEIIGAQALIASAPLSFQKNMVNWFNYRDKKLVDINQLISILKTNIFSEILIIDWENEGKRNGFNIKLINYFPKINTPIIAFGGISEILQIKTLLKSARISSVAIGNFLNYKESSIFTIKNQLSRSIIRQSN